MSALFAVTLMLVANANAIPTDSCHLNCEDTPVHWSYGHEKGPNCWGNCFPNCKGSSQSPIDLLDAFAENVDPENDFDADEYSEQVDMTLVNNGHSAQVNLQGDVTVSGLDLPATYKAVQFHFHWGSDSSRGSEHKINGNAYPLEMHIVHYNTNYNDISQAAPVRNGLAVLGFIFEIAEEDNPALTLVIDNLEKVLNHGDEYSLGKHALSEVIPVDSLGEFFRYDGSLTTPPCSESVVWTVRREPLTISERQISKFRQLKGPHGHNIVDNFRPVQELNGRVIKTGTSD